MANLAITISNTLTALGGKESQLWGSGGSYPMVWGSSQWGLSHVFTQFVFGITIDNTLSPDTDVTKDILHYVDNTLSWDLSNYSETLQDSRGYYYEFYKPDTNAENRNVSTYTANTATDPTYTSMTVTSITWS